MSTEPHCVKVVFRHVGEDGEVDVETPWAMDLGGGRYQLDNNLWYAYRISCGDVFAAEPEEDGLLAFTRVLEKSGNRTVRVILSEPPHESAAAQAVLDGLVALGCDYEGAYHRLFSVNVPPRVALEEVAGYLSTQGVEWEYADPTYTDLFGEDA